MACCTYLNDYEVGSWHEGVPKKLGLILDEVNAIPGERWAAEPVFVTKRRWFRKQTEVLVYLYWHVSFGEWQIINFAGNPDSSINHCVPWAMAWAYLCGRLGGLQQRRKEDRPCDSPK